MTDFCKFIHIINTKKQLKGEMAKAFIGLLIFTTLLLLSATQECLSDSGQSQVDSIQTGNNCQ